LVSGPCQVTTGAPLLETGVKPAPLRLAGAKVESSGDLAALQRSYRRLVELGLEEEAAEVAEQIARSPSGAAAGPIRQASMSSSEAHTAVSWSQVRQSKISFHFDGSSLDDVAKFFHMATGMSVRVQSSPTEAPPSGVHCQARDKSVEEALGVALGGCGLAYSVIDGEIVIAKPAVLALHQGATPIPK
jgi:hypothetical protein